jgi:ABC-type uncharacterized transport system ATPase subunit
MTALRTAGITKRFDGVVALDDVDFELREGEVHAVLGENGAGKSTLMNILGGVLIADAGTVLVDGRPVAFHRPKDAIRARIGMVHQRLRLVDELTVAENLALGGGSSPRAGRSAARRHALECAERYRLAVDLDARVGRLSLGERQRVEILRALMRGAQVLMLDEPTAVLTPQESDQLCANLRELAAEGRAVVFVSHKLAEVMAVADRITVMRRGRRIATLEREGCSVERLAGLMVGDTPPATVGLPAGVRRGRPVLVVDGISVEGEDGRAAVDGVSLSVHEHEIVGVAGVAGNGQRELAEALTGLRPTVAGRVLVGDRDLSGSSARRFHEAGVGHIPEDRWATGLIPDAPIWSNAILRAYRKRGIARGPLLSVRAARRMARDLCAGVRLSTDDLDTPVGHLSGGNAQRLLTGRELAADPKVLVAVHPTQGLDIGAIADVHGALVAARARGLATLVVSEDLDELLAISDRIVVMYDGRIAGELVPGALGREAIGLLMGGEGDRS